MLSLDHGSPHHYADSVLLEGLFWLSLFALVLGVGEKIVLSWIIWADRETGAKAHEGMSGDPRITEVGEMPFDGKMMIMGASSQSSNSERAENLTPILSLADADKMSTSGD